MAPFYETYPNNTDPATFHASNPFNYGNFASSDLSSNSTPYTMGEYDITTPSSLHDDRSIPYAGLPGHLITPFGHQVGRSTDYQYANPGMSFQDTPMPPSMYGSTPYDMQAPERTAQSHGMVAYDGGRNPFSDDSFGTADSPTPKPRSMPMPTQYPPSLPSSAVYGLPFVPLSSLKYKNVEDAEAEASGRTALNVDDDDYDLVESNKHAHVAAIIAAFDGEFRTVPNVPLTVAEKLRWVKYQTEQCDKVEKYLAKNQYAKEASAWMLLEALIDTHKFGYKKGVRISAPDMCCSARFVKIVCAIRNYAVIRFDLVRMLRFEDLATSPSLVVSRKVANWRGNAGKVKRDELNKEYAAAHGVEYKTVLGNKRKYKSLQPIDPVIQEGNEDTSGMKTPPLGSTSGTKRKRSTDSFDEDSAPSTPVKSSRKSGEADDNVKRATVIAGPDADI